LSAAPASTAQLSLRLARQKIAVLSSDYSFGQAERPSPSVVVVENECRDVPGVVFAPVVTAFQRQSGDPQCLRHSWALRQLVGAGEGQLRVDVTVAERVGGPSPLALPRELMAIVVAPARPGADPGLVLGREQLARLAALPGVISSEVANALYDRMSEPSSGDL
jgi:hypothetical protein